MKTDDVYCGSLYLNSTTATPMYLEEIWVEMLTKYADLLYWQNWFASRVDVYSGKALRTDNTGSYTYVK